MNTISKLILVTGILLAASPAYAEGPHGHEHEAPVGGPKGGRWLENTEPRAEFFVEKDLSVTVTLYDKALNPVEAAAQQVSVIAEAGGEKTTLDFEKKDGALFSKGALPQEQALNLVVRFQQTPNDQPRNYRFVYEDHTCDVCHRAEYACICGH